MASVYIMLKSIPTFENLKNLLHESTSYCFVKINERGEYEYMNKHFLDRYSYLYADNECQKVDRSIWHFDRDLSKAAFLKCINSPHESFSVNLKMAHSADQFTIANWEYRAHLDADGKVDGVIGIGRDITAHESSKDHIYDLTEVLNNVAHRQSHFVRRPLANVIALVNLLRQIDFEDTEACELIGKLDVSCNELIQEFDLFVIKTSRS